MNYDAKNKSVEEIKRQSSKTYQPINGDNPKENLIFNFYSENQPNLQPTGRFSN